MRVTLTSGKTPARLSTDASGRDYRSPTQRRGYQVTGGTRLTIPDMTARDWRVLADALPKVDDCDDVRWRLKLLSWSEGATITPDLQHSLVRRIWKGLAGGACEAGPIRIERVGRWGIGFVVEPEYAAFRLAPRRRRSSRTADGWDAVFQRLHDDEIGRRFAGREL